MPVHLFALGDPPSSVSKLCKFSNFAVFFDAVQDTS